MCLIGTLILLPALLLMRFAGSLALSGIVLLLVLSLFLSRLGKVSRLAVVLMLVLCGSIFLTWLHPRAILSRSTPDDTFSFTVSEATQNGKYIGIAVKRNGVPCPLSRISFYASEPIEVGDRVTVLGADLILSSEADASGVHASLVCRGKLSVKRDSAPILSLISQARHSFSRRLTQIGGNDGGALLSALLLGELDELPIGTTSAFRRLGISHVLAVSGMHLVVISGLLSSLLLRLRIPRRIRSPLVSLLLILYAMLVGGSPSILRALAMALVSELSFFVGKRTDSLSSLFFSGALLTILSPRMILSLSFQLSFAATFGIIVCALVIKKMMLSEHIPHLVYRFIVFPSLMSLSALIFTLPITLSTFGTLSLAALPANLLLAPMYELLLCLGIPALCIGPLAPIRFAVGGASRALLIATEQVSEIPFLLLDASHPLLSTLFTLLAALLLFHLLILFL
jgi:ComEC/Rec2-related protein